MNLPELWFFKVASVRLSVRACVRAFSSSSLYYRSILPDQKNGAVRRVAFFRQKLTPLISVGFATPNVRSSNKRFLKKELRESAQNYLFHFVSLCLIWLTVTLMAGGFNSSRIPFRSICNSGQIQSLELSYLLLRRGNPRAWAAFCVVGGEPCLLSLLSCVVCYLLRCVFCVLSVAFSFVAVLFVAFGFFVCLFVCCLLSVVCGLWFVVCCLLFVVCCLLLFVCCLSHVVCGLLFLVCFVCGTVDRNEAYYKMLSYNQMPPRDRLNALFTFMGELGKNVHLEIDGNRSRCYGVILCTFFGMTVLNGFALSFWLSRSTKAKIQRWLQ